MCQNAVTDPESPDQAADSPSSRGGGQIGASRASQWRRLSRQTKPTQEGGVFQREAAC